MLLAKGKVSNLQAILRVGLQRFDHTSSPVQSVSTARSLNIREYRALVDTGAQLTCITRKAAQDSKLVSYGKTLISGVGGLNAHRTFLFHIGFWCENAQGRADDDGNVDLTYFGLPEAEEAVEIPDNASFDVIIGMNILGKFDLNFSRTGEFVLKI